jgi:ribosomal protein S18 acetylase RimI-like enzyme
LKIARSEACKKDGQKRRGNARDAHANRIDLQKGYSRMRLETDPEYQNRAFDFYKRLGFYEISRYGDDEDDIAMEMIL